MSSPSSFPLSSLWHQTPFLSLSVFVVLGAASSVHASDGGAAVVGALVSADRMAAAVEPELRTLMLDVLERNPGLAASAARARASRHEAPQARALPDPMLGATAYVAPPETRVGPQRFMTTLSQKFPWFGKRGLRERAAHQNADGLDADWEAQRLDMITQVRVICYELAFVDAASEILASDRDTLTRYEELARARYASGVGQEQGVVKLQAEITRDETRMLDLAAQRARLVAQLNALRDRPTGLEVPALQLPPQADAPLPPLDALQALALEARPELLRAAVEVNRADTLIELAQKEFKPDFTLGVTYALVGTRSDAPGQILPPPDNGSDVFGIQLSVNLPLHRGRLNAGLEQAAERRLQAVERRRSETAAIDGALGDLHARVRLTGEQIELFERALLVQAEQSLASAEAGYSAGTLGALDLLDAERTLLTARTGTVRARADHAIAIARLEGTLGAPLKPGTEGGVK
jgi:outer membrane protein TolC